MKRRSSRLRAGPAFRTLLGLALIPTAAAAALAAVQVMGNLAGPEAAPRTRWFLGGFGGYAGVYFLGLFRLRRLYVFAHELTHAIAVWMGGGKVYKLVIKADSGYVDLSRMNAFIALAPYWIPLYALATISLYRVLLWWAAPPYAREVFALSLGASLSFHFMHTIRSLWVTRQSDLEHAGFVLSLTLIVLLNALVLLAGLKCLFPRSVSLGEALGSMGAVTAGFWTGLGGILRWAL